LNTFAVWKEKVAVVIVKIFVTSCPLGWLFSNENSRLCICQKWNWYFLSVTYFQIQFPLVVSLYSMTDKRQLK